MNTEKQVKTMIYNQIINYYKCIDETISTDDCPIGDFFRRLLQDKNTITVRCSLVNGVQVFLDDKRHFMFKIRDKTLIILDNCLNRISLKTVFESLGMIYNPEKILFTIL